MKSILSEDLSYFVACQKGCDKLQGIYKLQIGDKAYIGKDSNINLNVRKNAHKNLLERNCHYNPYMQSKYNQVGSFQYEILYLAPTPISREELSKIEIKFIESYDTYENGLNLTSGGEGSHDISGSKNPMSKTSEKDIHLIIQMVLDGYTNNEIAEKFSLHPRYISLIRHGKRHKKVWADYTVPNQISNGHRRSLSYYDFTRCVRYIEDMGCSNAVLEEIFELSAGTGSRIRNKVLYKRYWTEWERERATTIESMLTDRCENAS